MKVELYTYLRSLRPGAVFFTNAHDVKMSWFQPGLIFVAAMRDMT